jgi:NAD(P)-dependent dehydrogenase (short-subunit alcohol dehydrogenase family)
MEHPTIIITGASRGLGAATAVWAARQGAQLVLAARSVEPLEQVARETNAVAVRCDVSQKADCAALVEKTLQAFGRIDGLVNNAGVIEPIAKLADADLQSWESSLAINLFGPVALIQKALPALRESQGRIVNISSGASTSVIPAWSAYSTAKAAIDQLTRILAEEETAITVLSIHPGILDTPMQAAIRAKGKAAMTERDYNRLNGLYESGRLVPVESAGKTVGSLVLYAPHDWSGQILKGNEPRVLELASTAQNEENASLDNQPTDGRE